ncbi:substrate-binding domain-containing protein [Paenibacillus segetis]|uniref:Ribose ABC transporter substrate-binding protein n=1 Tax=Paenibacillus segetis TaxID=1325360 RepID=A0ABQ1YWI6_9BACL|nr:substrate-binding domain-containing protein [Paenibacillus segetis]GGH40412.1 ribose ABC transporter substrate-binding protein [Paenibacillus segetis]
MKKLVILYFVLISLFLIYLYSAYSRGATDPMDSAVGLRGESDEKYVMVNYLTGNEYWKNCLKGFEDAAEALGVSVEYRGATQYDEHEEVTVLEQVIAKKPAGIVLSAINSEALINVIDKAVSSGIPVVLYDSNVPNSKAYSFLGTNNFEAGVAAAHKMGELVGQRGTVVILTQKNQLNQQQRVNGFIETLEEQYPQLKVIEVVEDKGDQVVSESKTGALLLKYPDLQGIFVTEAVGGMGVGNALINNNRTDIEVISFDTNKGTLDMVKDGVISATMAQGTWNMGYWSLMQLFHLKNALVEPVADWQQAQVPPLPTYIDTGISVVTKSNVEHFYAK